MAAEGQQDRLVGDRPQVELDDPPVAELAPEPEVGVNHLIGVPRLVACFSPAAVPVEPLVEERLHGDQVAAQLGAEAKLVGVGWGTLALINAGLAQN